MFVKWSCGCIGFIINNSNWVVKACDRSFPDPDIALFPRDMTDQRSIIASRDEYEAMSEEQRREVVPKPYCPLDAEETKQLLDEVAALVRDGHKFREIKWLLR